MNAGPLGLVALRTKDDTTVALDVRLAHRRAHSGGESPSVGRIDRLCWRSALRIQEQGRQLNLSSSMYEPLLSLSMPLFRRLAASIQLVYDGWVIRQACQGADGRKASICDTSTQFA